MRVKRAVLTLGKLSLGGLAFYGGIILGSILATMLGMTAPVLPVGADVETLGQYQLLVSLLLAGSLAIVSNNLAGGFLRRWLILAVLGWITYSLNTYLEAAIFTAYEAASTSTLIMQLVAIVLCSAVVAWFFSSRDEGISTSEAFQTYFSQNSLYQWAWRFLLVLCAFPVVYIVFGLLVRPFIINYYEQQLAGLALPGWDEIIPTLLLRSLLFLIACLPVFIFWQKSRFRLFITLGTTLFILVGGLYMLQAYWLPVTMRVVHSLEILADSFVYTGVVVVLLLKERRHSGRVAWAAV
ncbi:MAG: hypothetical protein R3293_22715 [Candidatus Promineifilaceae bacterium]|nr:hypothetical protein [Candidatus Promineifilaceae bacterium]